jgi:hypothetical protein
MGVIGRPRLTDYGRLTVLYLDAMDLGLPPVNTIAKALKISHKAAERRVHRARLKGYLPAGNPSTGRGTEDPHRSLLHEALEREAPLLASIELKHEAMRNALAMLDQRAQDRATQAAERAEQELKRPQRRPRSHYPRPTQLAPPALLDWFPGQG